MSEYQGARASGAVVSLFFDCRFAVCLFMSDDNEDTDFDVAARMDIRAADSVLRVGVSGRHCLERKAALVDNKAFHCVCDN